LPLVLASDDRVEVIATFDVAMTISGSDGDSANHSCRMTQVQPLAIPEYRLWRCPVPPDAHGAGQLSIALDNGPGSAEAWYFDTLVVGPGHRATDKRAKVRFRVAGRHLRMQLPLAGGFGDARGELWGKRLTAVCAGAEWSARRPYRHARIAHLRWPVRQEGVSVRFDRPLGGPPRWCLVEGRKTGGDVAFARFPRR
jgi:hypothetical protein